MTLGDRPHQDWFGDIASVAVLVGAFANFLSPIAATVGSMMSIAWFSILIWESKTGRNWRARWRRLYELLCRR